MELCPKCLFRCSQVRIAAGSGIDAGDRRPGKAEDMVLAKILRNLNSLFTLFDYTAHNASMHISKLTAVAFVKNQNNVLVPDGVVRVPGNKNIQFLNGRDDDPILLRISLTVLIFQLPLQNGGTFVSIGSSLFKAVIFLNGLVIQILPVNDKQHLVDIGQARRKLRRFERSQSLSASCGMPDISPCLNRACLLIVCGYLDPVQNALGRHDLIGPHDKQQVLGCEHTVFCQDVQNGMLCEKCLCKVHKIGNDLVVPVRPPGGKLKAVGGFLSALSARTPAFFDMACSGGVGIILCGCAVGDHENLYILIQSAARPKTVALIAVDLVERLFDRDAAPFQFHMDEGQTVH